MGWEPFLHFLAELSHSERVFSVGCGYYPFTISDQRDTVENGRPGPV